MICVFLRYLTRTRTVTASESRAGGSLPGKCDGLALVSARPRPRPAGEHGIPSSSGSCGARRRRARMGLSEAKNQLGYPSRQRRGEARKPRCGPRGARIGSTPVAGWNLKALSTVVQRHSRPRARA